MDWFRAYHGMPTDPKWMLVARLASSSCATVTQGHVVALWCALLDHASSAKPRGSVQSVDLESIAASFGWDDAVVAAIHGALIARRHIVDGCIRTWCERNPDKFDATNAVRQKRHREKKKSTPAEAQNAPDATPENNESNARYCVTGNASRQVTLTEEKEQSKSSFSEASKQAFNTSLKSDTPRTVRERAGAIVNAGEFWGWIAAQGIPAHIGIRTMTRGKLAEWIERGLSQPDLDEAMRRAQQSRQLQRSDRPVNIGFLACFVDDVLSGTPATITNGGSYERGDQLSREFASS